jgi:ferric-dicitrate binding protein FerR (iron transport regulator)
MPTHTFPLDGPINLHVRVAHGSVTVDTQDDLAEARVDLEPGKNSADLLEQTTVEMVGRTLTVSAPRQGGIFDLPVFARKGRSVDVHVLVPTGTAVRISTFTAPITIGGRVGGADLAFGSADAGVREVDGDLRVRYGNGTVRAAHVKGSVEIRSGSGSAQLGDVGGALSAGFGSGDLDVRVARGSVRSRSGSGAARLHEVHGDVDLATGSGRLEIGLPAGVSTRVDVTTGLGRVQSDLPIEDAPRSTEQTITLRARTGSGDVRLFRAA